MNIRAAQPQFLVERSLGFLDSVKIAIVHFWLIFLNGILSALEYVLFFRKSKNPKNIVIYKLGNIGDVVCAMPAIYAIKENYPKSRITLLTSPGRMGAVGAKDFLDGVSYLDEIKSYHSEDISGFSKILTLVRTLKKENYDLFIQLPDDWANSRVLLRNMLFARLIGVKSAFGFRLRTSNIFKKAQVDFTLRDTESVALLKLLAKNKIVSGEVKFEFPGTIFTEFGIDSGIANLRKENGIAVGVCMGGKTEDKRWPEEKFCEVLTRLGRRRKIVVIFFGAPAEAHSVDIAAKKCGIKYINFAGRPIRESIAAIKQTDMFLTNDTGPMHVAAAFKIPVVALFSIRTVLGAWFPYGENNICLYRRHLNCDYSKESCIKSGINAISADEVVAACEDKIDRIMEERAALSHK